ncbi:hypothetical protein [Catenovulum sediminis]|uniref:Uncharacterized protein n=1 Tax=Catenovulum sediminis TaxID=1740262 RepID=A0ABV1RHU8_9ALTE
MPGIAVAIVIILSLAIAGESSTLGMWVAIIGLGLVAYAFKDSKHEWMDTFWTGAFAFIVFGGGIALVIGLLSHLFT